MLLFRVPIFDSGSLVDKRTLLRRFTIAGFIGFTLIVVAVFVRQGWIAEVARLQVENAHQERDQIQRVLSRIKDVELGQRGFALSGDSGYLEPYVEALNGRSDLGVDTEANLAAAKRTLWDELGILQQYFAEDAAQRERAMMLANLARERVRYAQAVIQARTVSVDSAVVLIQTGAGKRIMDSTRAVVGAMLLSQSRYLTRLRAEEVRNLRLNSIMLYTVVAVFYVSWLLSLRVAARSRHRRLRAERDLRASHSLLQAVIDNSTRGLFTTGPDGRILIFNPAAEKILGYEASEVIGQKASVVLRGIHDPEELQRRRERLEQRLGRPVRGLEIFQMSVDDSRLPDPSWTLVRKDGGKLIAILTVSPLVGRDGAHHGHLMMFQDVTERRTMQRRLVESNAMFHAVLNGTNYAIFATDSEGRLTVFNKAAEIMLGMKAEQAVGHMVMELLHDLDAGEVEARAARIHKKYGRAPVGIELFTLPLEGDQSLGQEWTFKHEETGENVPIMLAVSEMKDDQGRVIGFVALARDITELRANERMKKEFISTVSHELRTPLTSIRGALGLVAGGAAGALPDGAREMISIAHRNSERLVRIINDILDIDKIDAGNLTLYPATVDARALLGQALESNAPYGEKHSVRFRLEEVPAEQIEVDPDRLMQVMANLLSNAAKFSPAGAEVVVDAQVLGGSLRVFVRDRGTGIPEAFRSRIFSKFAQAEGADSRRYEGTGLGLHITRKLIEAMGGTIDFTTETGVGTTFFFDVPLAARDAAGGPGGRPDEGARAPGMPERPRVLICEDDQDVGTLLRVLLERAGLAPDLVRSLAEARRRLATVRYAAMTLDLTLPDGSGLTLLRELRREEATRELPVIVVSARAEEGRRELKGDAIGMIDWVAKPINEERLQASLQRALIGVGKGGSHGKPRVLHVEDDADFRHVLESSLGSAAEWVGAASLAEAEACLQGGRFNLVVLDLDLPDGSGLALLERLKTAPGGPVPVLILSASETDNGVRYRVEAALVKSRLSEERIVETIMNQIKKAGVSGSRTSGGPA